MCSCRAVLLSRSGALAGSFLCQAVAHASSARVRFLRINAARHLHRERQFTARSHLASSSPCIGFFPLPARLRTSSALGMSARAARSWK